MYVIDMLEHCRNVAARMASVYRHLARQFQGDGDRVHLWRELALEAETHAEVLRRELKDFQAQDQSGSFLPELGDRVHQLDQSLLDLERRGMAAQSMDDALAVAVALEQTRLEDLYDDLVLQGEPAFKLISERVEAALAVRPNPTADQAVAKPKR